MDDRVYEKPDHALRVVLERAARPPRGMVAALPPSVPTGKPTNAEFPTSASTPPVNIMTPEPPLGAVPKPPAAAARPAAGTAPPRRSAGTAAGAGRRQEAAAGAEAAGRRGTGPARAAARGTHS